MGEVHSLLQTIHPQNIVVLFASPQCILNDVSNITNLIISHPTLLRFLVVDEFHLFTHFGKSFREEFAKLNEGLFAHVSGRINFLSLTATCTLRIIQPLKELIGMTHTAKHWSSTLNMVNPIVFIDVCYKQYPITSLKHTTEEHINPVSPLGNLIIFYFNVRKK